MNIKVVNIIRKPNFFEDFSFNGKKLSEFNGVIYNTDDGHECDVIPSKTILTEELPGVDGQIPYGGKYEPRPIRVNVYIENEIDLDLLVEWLSPLIPKPFYYVGDDRQLFAVNIDEAKLRCFYNNPFQGTMTLHFMAYDPYWYELTPYTERLKSLSINEMRYFDNKGNKESYPLIELRSNGDRKNIAIEINGVEMRITEMYDNLYIDTRYRTVYSINGGVEVNRYDRFESIGGEHKRSMPKLKVGRNYFKLKTGVITECNITCNSRWI